MTKIFIIIVIILAILILIWYNQCNKKSSEPFTQEQIQNNTEHCEDIVSDDMLDTNIKDNDNELIIDDSTDDQHDDQIKKKFMTRDHAKPGQYKHDDYAHGNRGGTGDQALEYIDESNDLMQSEYSCKDQFQANDETKGQYAAYQPENKKVDKYKTSEIFNCDNYLPDEKAGNPDWFDIVPDAIDVKNRHLINVSKPIGINTIGTSLRNPSYDIRTTPPNPKYVVSPWSQSTIEPDNNFKSLC